MMVSSASPALRTLSAYSRWSGVELGVEQQAGQPDHAVHRRADLVAHGGQERRLRARPVEGGVAGRGELGPGLSLSSCSSRAVRAKARVSASRVIDQDRLERPGSPSAGEVVVQQEAGGISSGTTADQQLPHITAPGGSSETSAGFTSGHLRQAARARKAGASIHARSMSRSTVSLVGDCR